MKFIARRWGSRSFYCGCLFYSVLNFHRQHKTNLVAGFRCTPTHTHTHTVLVCAHSVLYFDISKNYKLQKVIQFISTFCPSLPLR